MVLVFRNRNFSKFFRLSKKSSGQYLFKTYFPHDAHELVCTLGPPSIRYRIVQITIDCYDLTYWPFFSNAWQADCSIKVFWSSKSFVSNKVGVLLLNIHQFINLLWVNLLWLRITMQSYFFAYRPPYPLFCKLDPNNNFSNGQSIRALKVTVLLEYFHLKNEYLFE